MKNLLNLKGAKVLNRVEQKSINGGGYYTQLTCEMAGGEWVCVGQTTGACGCVFDDGPVDPPIQ